MNGGTLSDTIPLVYQYVYMLIVMIKWSYPQRWRYRSYDCSATLQSWKSLYTVSM